MRFFTLLLLSCCVFSLGYGEEAADVVPTTRDPLYSVAGYTAAPDEGSGRSVYGMNPGWKFYKGDVTGAQEVKFDDRKWEVVNLPHGLEILPEEASGGANYQGPAWFRKTLMIPEKMKGKKLRLYFEGIMGKSSVWVNGKLLKESYCGYLPVSIDVSDALKFGEPNVIAVKTDNSNDPYFPPGKPQEALDFSYFGGIYRDVYLIGTSKVYLTDPNDADTVAGGGVFFRTEEVTKEGGQAKVSAKVQVANETTGEQQLSIQASLSYPGDLEPVVVSRSLVLAAGAKGDVDLSMILGKARLWSPENPQLYHLSISVYQNLGKGVSSRLLDSCRMQVGIRTISFSNKGFVLNGKPYGQKLMGANRHQDFATLGNAVPNNLQWQDAVKLRDAGMKVIRCAHYPMDPAFMDACDRLGMFVIVATPGWQFWGNGDFAAKVEHNVRQMIRRDRNHPSVLMWEPILNETHFPQEFSEKMYKTVHEEYPYAGCFAACDTISPGAGNYDIVFSHPSDKNPYPSKPVFTREYGDYVDSWSAHNSPSRVARRWGEIPMLIQAGHYLKPSYSTTSVSLLESSPESHIGGCLWHPFDHQRGYHPDPFYGGIFDAYRQPKTSFYAYKSQRPVKGEGRAVPGKGPFIWIANELTPFSPEDVTVYTNCDAVRLSVNGNPAMEKKPDQKTEKLLHPPVVFEKAWNFSNNKNMTRGGKAGQIALVAEGIIDGKVVARHEVRPAKRAEKIRVSLDVPDFVPEANGSDIVQVIASVTDGDGNIKRLNNEEIFFEVEGPASIVGDERSGANPRAVEWGTAPLLVRMGTTPGKISIKASVLYPGANKPSAGMLEFSSAPSSRLMLGGMGERSIPASNEGEPNASVHNRIAPASAKDAELKEQVDQLRKELKEMRIREVERQQSDFGEKAK